MTVKKRLQHRPPPSLRKLDVQRAREQIAASKKPRPMDGSEERPIVYFEHDGSGPHEHVCPEVDDDGYDPCEHESAASEVREWLSRRKLLIGDLSAETIRAFETCIDDLEGR